MIFQKLHELIYFQAERYPSKNAFNHKILGRWEARSTKHFIEQMNQLSSGLLAMNLKKGDKIGLFCSYGSPEWIIIDMACMQVGLITVPINTNYTEEELGHILAEIELSYCFINEDLLADRLSNLGFSTKHLISFGNSIRFKSWTDIRPIITEQSLQEIKKVEANIDENDVATIIYTSGSTGKPKGVMLSHKNIVSNIKSIISLIPVNYRHKVASFLPLSHIFERMVIFTYISVGAKIYFIDDTQKLLSFVKQIKPDYISSVPRVLEKIHNEITVRIKKSNSLVRGIVRLALKAGEREPTKFHNKVLNRVSLGLADVFVYSKWRKVLGGRIKGIIVGSAAMQPHIARLYTRAGIPVKEGYGLTETSPVVSFNRFEPGGSIFGSVGIPIPGVEVKINNPDEKGEGEIVVRGPNVMVGYYKKPELTAEKIDKEKWFHTGDIGYFKKGRFLVISDRKKDIFKTSSGLYVYPQKLESQLKSHPAIDQCMIIGFQKPFVSALIIPDFKFLKSWCKGEKIHWTAELYMVENDRVKEYYDQVISDLSDQMKNHERIKKYTLLPKEWSLETEEYTPTLKLRRKTIVEKFSKVIDLMYR